MFETLAREAFLKGCNDSDAAEFALFRDPQTLNQAVQYAQTAAHNHKLLNSANRSRIRHVSFSNETIISPNHQSEEQIKKIFRLVKIK